jgi:hypothetical protein
VKIAPALPLAICGLGAACEPPSKPELLSRAEIDVVAQECNVSADAIAVVEGKLMFDPPAGMAQSSQACVLKQLRERLPGTAIEYASGLKGQAKKDEKKP